MNIFRYFGERVEAAIGALTEEGVLPPGLDLTRITVEPPRDASHGDLSTNAAMVLAKPAGAKPRELADRVAAKLAAEESVVEVSVAGPGFINLRLNPAFWLARVPDILRAGDAYGASDLGTGEAVNVEYVSANPTGPMHVGHVRGAVFGDALANLLEKVGYRVCREYYINDAGGQIEVYRDERLNPQGQAGQLGIFLAEALPPGGGGQRHTGLFRRLVPEQDYIVHSSGLWITLRSPLRPDEAPGLANVDAAHFLLPWGSESVEERAWRLRLWAFAGSLANRRKIVLPKHGMTDFGPVSERKLALEVQRVLVLDESLKANGFRPSARHPLEVVGLRRGGDYRWLAMRGRHRFAACAAWAIDSVDARVTKVIRREDVCTWPRVVSGAFTQQGALRVFDRLFRGQPPACGLAWARRTGDAR